MTVRFLRTLRDLWRDPAYRWLLVSVMVTLGTGTVFYSIVEDWSLLDSLYFSVVTLTTIGYGDFTPQTTLGKIFTISYIFLGLGLIATFVRTVAERAARNRQFGTRIEPGGTRGQDGEQGGEP